MPVAGRWPMTWSGGWPTSRWLAWSEPWTRKVVRWLTRHRTAVTGAAAAVLVGLVGLTALAALQSEANRRLKSEKDKTTDALIAETKAKRATEEALAQKGEALVQSELSRKRAEAVLAFLKDDVLAAARPEGQEGGLGKGATVRGAVDAAVARIAGSFQGQPTVEAEVRDTLGTTYYYLGELPLAIQQYERATDLRQTALGRDHPDTLISRTNLANAQLDAGRLAEAARMDEETLRLQIAKLGPDHPDTLTTRNNLANDYYALGRLADSARMHEETLRLRAAKLGPDDPLTLISRNNLAAVYRAAGRLAEAARMHEETLRLRTAKFGPGHPDTLISRDNLAETYSAVGRLAEAARHARGDVPALHRRSWGRTIPTRSRAEATSAPLIWMQAGRRRQLGCKRRRFGSGPPNSVRTTLTRSSVEATLPPPTSPPAERRRRL